MTAMDEHPVKLYPMTCINQLAQHSDTQENKTEQNACDIPEQQVVAGAIFSRLPCCPPRVDGTSKIIMVSHKSTTQLIRQPSFEFEIDHKHLVISRRGKQSLQSCRKLFSISTLNVDQPDQYACTAARCIEFALRRWWLAHHHGLVVENST